MLLSEGSGLELLLMGVTGLPWVQPSFKLAVQLLLGFPYSFTYSLMFKLARVDFCDLG